MPYHPSSELTTQQILFQLLILQKTPGTKIFTESFLNGEERKGSKLTQMRCTGEGCSPAAAAPAKGSPPGSQCYPIPGMSGISGEGEACEGQTTYTNKKLKTI